MGAACDEMPPPGKHPITLVTAYFELGGKPESEKNLYPFWIRNFLPYARWPLVIFCDEQSVDMLKEARGDKPAVWHVTRLEDLYVYKYLDDLKRLLFPAEQVEVRIARSLIWHEKHHFLRQALSENPFGSEMLFWCDIGRFRYDPDASWWSALRRVFRLYEDIEWPNLEVCRALPQDKVVLINESGADPCHINAIFFGGAVEASRRWCDAYYLCLEKRKQKGTLPTVEELVMASCLRGRRELAHVLPPRAVPYVLRKQGGRSFTWYLLNSRRFPWKYLCKRIFSGSAR